MKHYEVAAAILIHNDEILCMQRGKSVFEYLSYKFEFPGGKVEAGETKEQTLERELMEEMSLAVEVKPENHFITVKHTYPDFEVTMHSYICHLQNKEFRRNEHISEAWLKSDQLNTLDWAEADVPIVNKLMETL